jgi:hypothetical protein
MKKASAKLAKHEDRHDRHEARDDRHETGNDRHEARDDRHDNRSLIAELRHADAIYFADYEPLNNSGVDGVAILTVDYGKRNTIEDDRLTVRIIANGLDEGLHIQHMHGFETGQNAVTPDKEDDTDEDGYVELLEGIGDYGKILLNLDNEEGKFPITIGPDGSFDFKQTYHLLGDDEPHEGHAGDEITTFKNLDLNHLVIHGMFVPEGAGEGTPGEVGTTEPEGSIAFDQDTYKEVLPVAVAEIEELSFREARQQLQFLSKGGFDFDF